MKHVQTQPGSIVTPSVGSIALRPLSNSEAYVDPDLRLGSHGTVIAVTTYKRQHERIDLLVLTREGKLGWIFDDLVSVLQ